MPTHGHGQGYTDLNFLLPELVQRIEYRKGPYFAASGDFASAGAADIRYRTKLDEPFGQLSLGEDGYRRGVAGASLEVSPGLTLLGAFEAQRADGPWTVPERLRKRNGVFTASGGTTASGWSASLMDYHARWTATDQVPQRLIGAPPSAPRPATPSPTRWPGWTCTATTPAAPPPAATARRRWWRSAAWRSARAPRRCRGCRARSRCGS
jgi:outer membrane receptor protein involved in Fe transport